MPHVGRLSKPKGARVFHSNRRARKPRIEQPRVITHATPMAAAEPALFQLWSGRERFTLHRPRFGAGVMAFPTLSRDGVTAEQAAAATGLAIKELQISWWQAVDSAISSPQPSIDEKFQAILNPAELRDFTHAVAAFVDAAVRCTQNTAQRDRRDRSLKAISEILASAGEAFEKRGGSMRRSVTTAPYGLTRPRGMQDSVSAAQQHWQEVTAPLVHPECELDSDEFSAVHTAFLRLKRAGAPIDPGLDAIMTALCRQIADTLTDSDSDDDRVGGLFHADGDPEPATFASTGTLQSQL